MAEPKPEWTARRILKELADADRRRTILADFWRHADAPTRAAAMAVLAKTLHFREVTLRKMPPEKKADLLASRAGTPEIEQFLQTALLAYHTHRANDLMAAFLDQWKIPHTNGEIEADEVGAPDEAQVRAAVDALAGSFERADVRLYLAAVGLLMGDDWAAATWPVVDEMT
jgi:hypothetical protein